MITSHVSLFSAHTFELAKATPLGSEYFCVKFPAMLDTRQWAHRSYRICNIDFSSSQRYELK